LGTSYLGDGAGVGNVSDLYGQVGTPANGYDFSYPYGGDPDRYVDEFGATGAGELWYKCQQGIGRVVGNTGTAGRGEYKTITSSVIFGAFYNESRAELAGLMGEYLEYTGPAPDETDPGITEMQPQDGDYPDGVPVDTSVVFHVTDDYSGCDTGATECTLTGTGGEVTWGDVDIDDSEFLDMEFEYTPESELEYDETYTVEVTTYDNAGNGPVEASWEFTTELYVETTILPESFGGIKAKFAEGEGR
jgi:hypothetical protein